MEEETNSLVVGQGWNMRPGPQTACWLDGDTIKLTPIDGRHNHVREIKPGSALYEIFLPYADEEDE